MLNVLDSRLARSVEGHRMTPRARSARSDALPLLLLSRGTPCALVDAGQALNRTTALVKPLNASICGFSGCVWQS